MVEDETGPLRAVHFSRHTSMVCERGSAVLSMDLVTLVILKKRCYNTRHVARGGAWGVGFGVWGLGFGVQNLVFRVQGLVFRIRGLGFGARDLWVRVEGSRSGAGWFQVSNLWFGVEWSVGCGIWGLARVSGLGFVVCVCLVLGITDEPVYHAARRVAFALDLRERARDRYQ